VPAHERAEVLDTGDLPAERKGKVIVLPFAEA
jgi:hypothetical protein